ncbi:glycosyltransferase [Georgenia sp. SUBG003]|uniref:glycosyltransferase n=1 Tax=Georgenia sp. SUBG003 TaxID=1497974 RepID=UPI003AB6EC79
MLCKNPGRKLGIVAERPTRMRPGWRNLFGRMLSIAYYRTLSLRYGSRIQLFFALGRRGVEEYRRLGFRGEVLYPYMYSPPAHHVVPVVESGTTQLPLRFVYVGRLRRQFKGVHVLMEAIDRLSGGDWRLDFVGGYGELLAEIEHLAAKHPNVEYLGAWNSAEVVERLRPYDVCIVPSTFDGWKRRRK